MTVPDETAPHALRCALAAEAVKLRLAILAQAWKANFNPSQARVPAGNSDGGQWTDGGGGSGPSSIGAQYAQNTPRPPRGGVRPVLVNGRWVQPTTAQSIRLAAAQLRADAAIARVRTLDPNWRPQPSAYESVEGLIQRTDAIAREAQARVDQLRSGIGGNFGPVLTASLQEARGTSPPQSIDGSAWISAYRSVHSRRDLFGQEAGLQESDTVAVTESNGKIVFGVNSSAPTHTSADRIVAQQYVNKLVEKYPDIMSVDNIGQKPNDAVYHAESTVLLRAAGASGGTLKDRTVLVHVDSEACVSCDLVLPKLGLALGNPTVTFIGPRYVQTMRDGQWVSRIRR